MSRPLVAIRKNVFHFADDVFLTYSRLVFHDEADSTGPQVQFLTYLFLYIDR